MTNEATHNPNASGSPLDGAVRPGAETLCMCKDRPLSACPGEWEPGCDLGNNPAFLEVSQQEKTHGGFPARLVKQCPFCGRRDALKLTTAQELAEEGEDDPEPWMHSESWAVLCDASRPGGPGGCGASGGFFPSEDAAVAAWNRRA